MGNAVTAPAIAEVLKEVERIRTEYVTDEALAQAKAQYLGQFILATERPQTIANYAINIKVCNLPADFYKNYIANIEAVTKEDVLRVANHYYTLYNFRIIVVGKASEIKADLKKLTQRGQAIPLYEYDKYANKI